MCVGGGACSRENPGQGRHGHILLSVSTWIIDRSRKDRPIKLGTNRKMFSSSSSLCAPRTAAPLPLMGCCVEAMVSCGRVLTISLAQRRHATCGACDWPGETESCQSRKADKR